MNGALGYMYANHIPYSPDTLLKINRKLVADVLEDFNDVTVENARTNGERLYALYGMKGARGEALSGYHTVLKKALPVLKHQLDRGLSLNDAGAVTLLYIHGPLRGYQYCKPILLSFHEENPVPSS